MKIDVSVVVPLYNKKDYLKFSVDSILNQTHKNLEVLIVDDCSTDGSLELCRELYGHDERVRIIQQPNNMGPGAARNRGINEARGKYMLFVDSDDEILPDTMSKLLDVAEKYSADIIHNTQFVYPLPDEDGNIPLELLSDGVQYFFNDIEDDTYTKYTQVTLLSDDMASRFENWKHRRLNWSVCSKMFRRDFLVENGIYFSDMKFAEDMIFCFECLFKSKNYVIVPGGNYVYRVTGSSLTRGKKTSSYIIAALKAQIAAVHNMRKILGEVPFFVQNKQKAISALERVLDDLELGYIRPSFQAIGEETLRSDNLIHEFMRENFGDNAPYIEFLFYELHKNYEPVLDYTEQSADIEVWKAIAKSLREKEQNQQ